MQLSPATLFLVSALSGLSATVVQAQGPSSLAYFTLNAPEGGCIGLKLGAFETSRPFLRPCVANDDSILWTIDEENRFRSKLDYSKCMQAGVKDSVVKSGTVLRMVTCGVSDLQKFNLTDFVGEDGLFGTIKPESSSELCMVHRGPNANIDSDPIVLKVCANLTLIDGDERARGWEGEFPEENEQDKFFFTLEAPGGGCMGLKNNSTQRGNALLLRTCTTSDSSLLWTLDEESRFRSKADITMCMQVGRKTTTPGVGTTIRVVPCGVSDLQKFDLSEFIKESSLTGPIKPANSTELCVVHRNGPSTVIGAEPILLKDCEGLGNSIRTAGWTANFVVV
jgi:hypothetical protein